MSDDSDITDKEWSAGYDQARSDLSAGRQIIQGMVCIPRAQYDALMTCRDMLKIYSHAHDTGNSVPPYLVRGTKDALRAVGIPEGGVKQP